MNLLKTVLRAFAKKCYEADVVMAIDVKTLETRGGQLVNDFVYAITKTGCADKSDITIGDTQTGYYIVMVKTAKPLQVLKRMVTVCSNRYVTRFIYAVRHRNGWLLETHGEVAGIETEVDQTRGWVDFWYSDSSIGGEVLSVPKCIRCYPCLAISTEAEDVVSKEHKRAQEDKKSPSIYTLDHTLEQIPSHGPDIPDFMNGTSRRQRDARSNKIPGKRQISTGRNHKPKVQCHELE